MTHLQIRNRSTGFSKRNSRISGFSPTSVEVRT